jgi:hypothetical protein
MELAIIGGLFGVGWAMSAKGSTPRAPIEVAPLLPSDDRPFPFDPDVEGAALVDRDTERTRTHVARTIREVTPNFPDVISERRAHVDSQRRMETFTGTDETWRHRRETPKPFAPGETLRGPVTSGGTIRHEVRNDAQVLKDRAVFGGKMHNVLPFEQQRVGPGLGVGANVPSIDGLHSQFRIMPTDAIDETRINQLPGRAPSGGALQGMDRASRRYDHFERQRPSLVDVVPNVVGPRGAVDAGTAHPDPLLRTTRANGTSTALTGGTFAASMPGPCQPFDVTTLKKPMHGLRGVASGNGVLAPTETSMAYTRDALIRRARGPEGVTGTSASGRQVYVRQGTRQTPRRLAEDQRQHMTAGAAAATIRAGNGSACWVLKDTTRERMNPCVMPGAAATVASGAAVAPECMDSSALREQPARNAGGYSVLKKTSTTPGFRMGPGRETCGRTEVGALPGGRRGDAGRVQRPIRTNVYDTQAPQAGSVPNAQQRADPGYRTPTRKLTSVDPRTCPDSLGLGLTFDRTDNYVAVR